MRLLLKLPAQDHAPAEARAAIIERIGDQLPEPYLQDLLVVVSELVSNAVVHGGLDPTAGVTVHLEVVENLIRGEVVDLGGGFERGETAGSGFGLLILEAIAHRWEVESRAGRTRVRFELRPREDGSDIEAASQAEWKGA